MGLRARQRTGRPVTPRCHCGLTYAAFRPGYYSAKGSVAPPAYAKREAWEQHLTHCDNWTGDAVSFDPERLGGVAPALGGPGKRRAASTVLCTVSDLAWLPADPGGSVEDDWGGPDPVTDAFLADWSAREREAMAILGADAARYMEAA